MASVTLTESAKLSQNMLVQGVIEDFITVDRMFEVLPFLGIEGNSLAYNREGVDPNTIVMNADVGDTISAAAKNPMTFSQQTSQLQTFIGDAEVNGLISATRSNIQSQRAAQVSAKAKGVARTYRQQLVTGSGTAPAISGLYTELAAGQKASTGANGSALSFAILDEMLDLVTDKDGEVDWMMMPSRTLRSYFALLRGLGGAGINETVALPSGRQVPAYRGVPIFRNDYMPVNQTKGTGTALTTILAGTFDDGSQQVGISGLSTMENAGVVIENVGVHQSRDETITRVKAYWGLAVFSEKGLAGADGITD